MSKLFRKFISCVPASVGNESGDVFDDAKCCLCKVSLKSQRIGSPDCCEHKFCLECLKTWTKNANVCPVDGRVYRHIIIQNFDDSEDKSEIDLYSVACEVCSRTIEDKKRARVSLDCDDGLHHEYRCTDKIRCSACIADEKAPNGRDNNDGRVMYSGDGVRLMTYTDLVNLLPGYLSPACGDTVDTNQNSPNGVLEAQWLFELCSLRPDFMEILPTSEYNPEGVKTAWSDTKMGERNNYLSRDVVHTTHTEESETIADDRQ